MKKIIAILIVIAVAVIGYVKLTEYFNTKEATVEESKPVVAEWCFKKLMPYGQNMSIVENEGGNYQYQLYAANDGVEVWVPCE